MLSLKSRDVLEQWQRDPQAQFSRYVSQRITCRLTGEGRTPRQTCIDLDDVVLQNINTQRSLQNVDADDII